MAQVSPRIEVDDDSLSPWKTEQILYFICISIPLVMSFAHRIGAVFAQSESTLQVGFFLFEKLEYVSYLGAVLEKKLSENGD